MASRQGDKTVEINRIGIVGSGPMACRLALVAATKGITVTLVETSKENLEKVADVIRRSLKGLLDHKEITEEENAQITGRVQLGMDFTAVAKVPLLVEDVSSEKLKKGGVLRQLDEWLAPSSVILTCLRDGTLTELAALVGRAPLVVGAFAHPAVTSVPMVEVVRGLVTSDGALNLVRVFFERMGWKSIVSRDYPGFSVNRLLLTTINEAASQLYQGLASAEDIDAGFASIYGTTRGPLAIADEIGVDYVVTGLKKLHEAFGESRYLPSPVFFKLLEAGFLGKKTKQGFFSYS